jgi:hypothetical protein
MRFDSQVFSLQTGWSYGAFRAASDNPAADRRTIIEGLRAPADTAGEVGFELGFEATRKNAGSIVSTLPEILGIIEDIGAPISASSAGISGTARHSG